MSDTSKASPVSAPGLIQETPIRETRADTRDTNILIVSIQGEPDPVFAELPELPEGLVKPVRHRITSIAFVRAKLTTEAGYEKLHVVDWRSGGSVNSTEEELLSGFWKAFDKWKPVLVTFGGRNYGIPLLKYRSMRYAMTAKHFNDAGRNGGYNNRYSQDLHVDLMDTLSDFRASPFPSLAEMALLVGTNSLEEILYRNPDVRMQAVQDAGTIFATYLSTRLFMGKMTEKGAQEAIESLHQLYSENQAKVG